MTTPTRSPRSPRAGREFLCGRASCRQLLAMCRGDELDCFTFTLNEPVRLKCERCKFETKWRPGEPWHPDGATGVDTAKPSA